LKGDQWGFLPGPGAGIAGVTSVRATVFLIISAGGCAWRAALDIAATKFAAGCAEGGQVAKDTLRGPKSPPPTKAVPWKLGQAWTKILFDRSANRGPQPDAMTTGRD
jgi:hypothetical protein